MRIFKSIFSKISALNTLYILLIVGSSIMVNNIYLEKYYSSKRERLIIDYANEFKEKKISDSLFDEIEEIKSKYNINISVFEKRGRLMGHSMMNTILILRELDKKELNDLKNKKIIIKRLFNETSNTNEILAIFNNKEDILITVTTPISSISEAVNIANEFNIIIAFIIIIIGLILSIFITRKLSKPLKRLKIIAEKMAHLDFSEKFNIKTGDEIEDLGKTINYLSNELELNITKLNSHANKLNKEIEEEKKLEVKRIELISNVSHELKTPISLVGAYAEGLKDNIENNEDRDHYCNVIINENKKMDRLVKELLEFMKMKSEEKALELDKFKINNLITKSINKFSLDIAELKVKKELNLIKNIEVIGNMEKIEQVLDNFISNAINNVTENGIISIEEELLDNILLIKIYNTGKNIDNDKINKIWDAFFKVDKSRNRKYGGTGLGLSIVKDILEKHKSKYGVNNLDNGVEFYFELKLK